MITVPSSIVDNTFVPFPEGTYRGALEDCKLVKNDVGSWAGLEVAFVNIEPVGDSPEDARPFRDTITIRVKDESILDVEDFSKLPNELFGLRLGGGLLGGLAEAFDAGTRTDDGIQLDLEEFIVALQDGSYKGAEATFTTRQREREYVNKEGNKVKTIETHAQRFIAG